MKIEDLLRLFASIMGDAYWTCANAANRELLTELSAAMRRAANEMESRKAAE